MADDLARLEEQVAPLVIEAGEMLAHEWQHSKEVRFKQGADPVTQYDIQIEKTIRQELAKLLPEAGFIVEEGQTDKTDGFNWVIDPIDQTKNFVGQIPIFYVHVALLEKDEPVLGVIYNPVSKQLFSASKWNGTKLNGIKMTALAKKRLDQAIVDIDFGGPSESLAWRTKAIEKLAQSAFRVRMSAGAYAPYLITGGIDLFIVVNETTKTMDQTPRIIIMREAGLVFEQVSVGGRPILIAGYPDAVREALAVLDSVG